MPGKKPKLEVIVAGLDGARTAADLHQLLICQSPLTRLGPWFLADVYYDCLIGLGLGNIILANVDGETAGFITYTLDTKTFLSEVARRRWATLAAVAKQMWRKPLTTAATVIQSALIVLRQNAEPGAEIRGEFLTMGVVDRFRDPAFIRASGISVAKSLIRAAQAEVAAGGGQNVKLFTLANAVGPNALYTMMGATKRWSGMVRGVNANYLVLPTTRQR